MHEFGEWEVRGDARAETCFHFRTSIASVVLWLVVSGQSRPSGFRCGSSRCPSSRRGLSPATTSASASLPSPISGLNPRVVDRRPRARMEHARGGGRRRHRPRTSQTDSTRSRLSTSRRAVRGNNVRKNVHVPRLRCGCIPVKVSSGMVAERVEIEFVSDRLAARGSGRRRCVDGTDYLGSERDRGRLLASWLPRHDHDAPPQTRADCRMIAGARPAVAETADVIAAWRGSGTRSSIPSHRRRLGRGDWSTTHRGSGSPSRGCGPMLLQPSSVPCLRRSGERLR
jgi:hypothetical protein